jgi:hypothetical protein
MLFKLIRNLPNFGVKHIYNDKLLNKIIINNQYRAEFKFFKTKSNNKNDENTQKPEIKYVNRMKKFSYYLLAMSTGLVIGTIVIYFLQNRPDKQKGILKIQFDNSDEEKDAKNVELDIKIKVDLNEVYERTAVVFLSNPEVNFILNLID